MLVLEFIAVIFLLAIVLVWNLLCALFIIDLEILPKGLKYLLFIPPLSIMILLVPSALVAGVILIYMAWLLLKLTFKQLKEVIYLYKQK